MIIVEMDRSRGRVFYLVGVRSFFFVSSVLGFSEVFVFYEFFFLRAKDNYE